MIAASLVEFAAPGYGFNGTVMEHGDRSYMTTVHHQNRGG